ncbi:MAG: lysostaphin resistance A-like protein, partial [Candidatus Bipolaricaulaceae bacterium]
MLLTALFFAVQAIVAVASVLSLGSSAAHPAIVPWLSALGVSAGAVAVWFAGRKYRALLEPSPLRSRAMFLIPTVLLVLGVSLFHPLFFAIFKESGARYREDLQTRALAPFWTALMTTVLVPAVFEELAFRHVIQTGLARAYGARRALLLTSVLFGVGHIEPIQIIAGFTAGLAFGYVRHVSRSLLPAIVGHGFLNLLAVIGARRDTPQALAARELSPGPLAGLGLVLVVLAVIMCRALVRRWPPPVPLGEMPPQPQDAGGPG